MRLSFKNIFLSSTIILSGCASTTHFNKTVKSRLGTNNSQQIISIDAKQRVVTSTVNEGLIRTCAEPSPDALSALAASQGTTFSKEDLEAAISNSYGEGASSIGLRTQSIQLMRDAMYRLCEGYMSGSLDNLTFETLHRRFQTTMVAILAIEQLTGVVQSPATKLGTSTSAGNIEELTKYTELTEVKKRALDEAQKTRDNYKSGDFDAARKTLSDKKAELKNEDGNADNALSEEEKLRMKAEQKAFEDAENKLNSLTEIVELKRAEYEVINSARIAALSGSASVTTEANIISRTPTEKTQDLSSVSTAVKDIVESTLSLGFAREFCATILVETARKTSYGNHSNDESSGSGYKLNESCLAYLDTNTNMQNAKANLIRSKASIVEKLLQNEPTNDEMISLLTILNKLESNMDSNPQAYSGLGQHNAYTPQSDKSHYMTRSEPVVSPWANIFESYSIENVPPKE